MTNINKREDTMQDDDAVLKTILRSTNDVWLVESVPPEFIEVQP